jgi:hypothetical protein
MATSSPKFEAFIDRCLAQTFGAGEDSLEVRANLRDTFLQFKGSYVGCCIAHLVDPGDHIPLDALDVGIGEAAAPCGGGDGGISHCQASLEDGRFCLVRSSGKFAHILRRLLQGEEAA